MQSLYDIFNEKIYIFSVLHKYFSVNDSMILYFVVYPYKQFEKAKLVYKIWLFVSCNISENMKIMMDHLDHLLPDEL